MIDFLNGDPAPKLPKNELFADDPKVLYELALKIGQERFGSECKHEQVKNGHCQKCLRKVV